MNDKTLGVRMAEQNNLATQFPIWIVEEDVKRFVPEDWDYEDSEEEDGQVSYYVVERKPNLMAGFFFTHQACKDHIQANHYHYDNPKPYCISAWRNPELQGVMHHLIHKEGIDNKDIPSHYKGVK